MKRAIFAAIILLTYSASAHAFLGGFFEAIGQALTSISTIAVTAIAYVIAGPAVAALTFATQVYSAYKSNELKKQQEEQRRAAIESYNASLKDRTVTAVTTEAPHIYVYGRARVGSAVVAIFSSGSRDEYQHLICVHCAHEVDAIEEVYISGKALGTLDGSGFAVNSEYGSNVRVIKHLGGASDPADATLISEVGGKWDANRVLRGFTYTYIRLNLNQQEFQGGIPSIEVLIKGKKVFDPRTNTTAWSDNPALCLYDYLRSDFCGVPITDIPSADVDTAADICDELITVGTLSNVARYTCNGTVSSDQDQSRVITQFVSAMAGGINSTTWEMWAGAYTSSVLTIEQEDIVGALSITPGISDADIYNGVTGRFISDENGYVATDFKPYQNTTYRNADGADLFVSLEYPFTDKTQRIHNLARIFVEDQRNSFTVKGTFSLKCWDVKVGQRVQLNSSFFGFTNKVFRLVGKAYAYTGTVELTLKEDAAEIWDLADSVVIDATPNSDLPNPFDLAAPGTPFISEELYETSGSAGVKSRAIIEASESQSIRSTGYIFEYKLTSSSVWTVLPTTVDPKVLVDDLAPGVYNFRVKAENAYFSTVSDYSGTAIKEILGLTAKPADVTNFNVIALSGRALASWNLTGDLDVKIGGRVVVRHTPETSLGSWESSIILEEFNGDAVNGNLPLLTGTYFAKFKDSSGNYSNTAASFLATEALVTGYNTTDTITEHPDFLGTKTNLAAVDNVLKLDGATTIDDEVGNIDDWAEIDTLGGIVSMGTYLFNNSMDFGSVTQRKVDINIQTLSYDSSDLVDIWSDFDSVDSIDGGVINSTDATLYYRATNDNPSGSPTWGDWTQFIVADVNCRALQFKLELTSAFPTHQIEVSSLTARAREAV